MSILFVALIVIACALLIVIVLVQNPKGGGLSSSFGGGGTQLLGGVKKTTDFLDRGTWVLAIVLVGLVLGMNVMTGSIENGGAVDEQSEISDELINNPVLPPAQNNLDFPQTGNTPPPAGEDETPAE